MENSPARATRAASRLVTENSGGDEEDNSPTRSTRGASRLVTENGGGDEDVLPSFTDKLRACGVYDEYADYQKKYRRWRTTDALGISIDAERMAASFSVRGRKSTVVGGAMVRWPTTGRPVGDFKYWYPTPQKFKFFYTISYWVAIFTLQGSFLLNFTSAIGYFDTEDVYDRRCYHWIDLMVSVLFLSAVYLPYLELINLTNTSRRYIYPESWSEVFTRAEYVSAVGVLSFLVAMIAWIIPASIRCCPASWQPEGEVVEMLVFKLPEFIGGVGFFIGGICECVHNRHVESFLEPVAFVSVLNCIGGLCFLLSCGSNLFVESTQFAKITLFAGGICYSLCGLFLVAMWRANDFGCGLLSQLNNAVKLGHELHLGARDGREGVWIRFRRTLTQSAMGRSMVSTRSQASLTTSQTQVLEDSGTESEEPKQQLSLRGVSFLVVYCWLFSVTIINCISSIAYFESTVRHVTDFVMELVWIFTVLTVLIVHSAITCAPQVQPYRLAVFSTRFLLVAAGGVQTTLLVASVAKLRTFGRPK